MNWVLLIVFFLSVGIASLLCSFFIKGFFGFSLKKTKESAVRFSSQSKPIYGGIVFFVSFLIFTLIYFFSPLYSPSESETMVTLLITVSISFFMGLADDLMSTSPLFKFLVQIVCAFVFIKAGIYINISPINWINYSITILWVVGIMNSINMLDNMDAITSSVSFSIITTCLLFLISPQEAVTTDTVVMASASGALLGFLFFNWAPAKMYMGDNGSQYLGILLAYIGIKYFWNSIHITEGINYALNLKQVIIVALAFVVPLSDTTTVTINRLLKKKSPFIGGRDHTTHHLFYLGLSVRKIGILMFTLNLIGVVLASILIYCTIKYEYVYLFAIYPILVFALLYVNTKITKQK